MAACAPSTRGMIHSLTEAYECLKTIRDDKGERSSRSLHMYVEKDFSLEITVQCLSDFTDRVPDTPSTIVIPGKEGRLLTSSGFPSDYSFFPFDMTL